MGNELMERKIKDNIPVFTNEIINYFGEEKREVLESRSVKIDVIVVDDVSSVNVENEVIYGDYHDDLVSINNTIMIGCAIPLVIYFFYCIYRMLLKGRI